MHCAPSFLAIASVALLAAPAMAQVSGGAEVSGSVSIGTAPPPPPPAAQPTPPPPPPVYAPAPPQPTYVAQPGYYPPPPPPPPPRDLHAREHDGFYFRGALGGGYLGTTGEVAGRAGPEIKISGGGLALDLAFGGTVARGLVIGGDLFFQQAVKPKIEYGTFSGTTESNVNFLVLGPMIDWFPNPFGGFHVSATLGLAGLSVSDQNGNTQGNERGFGASFGTGYDFWISDQWSLGILGRFSGGSVRSSDTGGIYAKDSVGTFSVLFSVLNH